MDDNKIPHNKEINGEDSLEEKEVKIEESAGGSVKGDEKKYTQETEEYRTRYLRALADYQNLERRVRLEQETIVYNAKVNVVLAFLPFLDNLEKAEIFVKDAGLRMIKDHFYQTLKELGIREIDILDKEFDPHLAEAIDIVEGEKDDIVVEIVRKGFMLGERVLRVAQVKVSKRKTKI